jgi:uncharacterized protein YbaP (TraB family)
MTAAPSLADRFARTALSLLAAINTLFVLAFFVAILLATRQAAAEMPVCAGKDMLAGIAAERPQAYAQMRAEAAAMPNGKGLLWRIEKEGAAPSFLLGTMHVSDPRVVTLSTAAQAAFDHAKTVVIETTDVLDQAKMGEAMLKRPELLMFTDATTLPGLMSEEERKLADEALARRGLSLTSVQKMKPWIVAALVSMPACELARKNAGAPVLDIKLAEEAKAAGKQVKGLETMIDQLEAMASLPMDLHVQGLLETLRLGDEIDDLTETMVRIYESGETGLFWPFFETVMPPGADEAESYAAFQEAMVDARNRHMAEAARPILDEGGAFVAVGALHLAGKDGLVALLRKDGYAVEAVE